MSETTNLEQQIATKSLAMEYVSAIPDPEARNYLGVVLAQAGQDLASLRVQNEELRQALLPFAAAAGRPGRLLNCETHEPLADDVVVGIGVKVAAWRMAERVTGH